jgi:hypothetical protein
LNRRTGVQKDLLRELVPERLQPMIYTHVLNKGGCGVPSPFDDLR